MVAAHNMRVKSAVNDQRNYPVFADNFDVIKVFYNSLINTIPVSLPIQKSQ